MATEQNEPVEAPIEVTPFPRFFVELNEPILVKGLNLDGLGLPVLMAATFVGLGMWLAVGVTAVLAVALCLWMAKNPTVVQELRARFDRSQIVSAMDDSYVSSVRIARSGGLARGCEWLVGRRIVTKKE